MPSPRPGVAVKPATFTFGLAAFTSSMMRMKVLLGAWCASSMTSSSYGPLASTRSNRRFPLSVWTEPTVTSIPRWSFLPCTMPTVPRFETRQIFSFACLSSSLRCATNSDRPPVMALRPIIS